jgi:hypothetical protein
MIGDSTRASQTEPPIISFSTSSINNFVTKPATGVELRVLFQKRREYIHVGSVATSLLLTF